MQLSARYRFSAAMRLDGYAGPCGTDHGYEFVLDVAVDVPETAVADGAMPLDFVVLDERVDTLVIRKLHRTHLSEIIENPTLERLALWIRAALKGQVPGLESLHICAGERYSVHLAGAHD